MSKPFFITTAIDYTNGAPHIGHAYEKVLADVIARYHRLKGREVFFLTGVDQHGQKVQQSAEKQGIAPQEFVDGITQKFLALWEKLDISHDRWAATTDPLHKKCVQRILQRLFDEGQLYKAKQGGHYSVRQEQFLTDKERNEQGEFGPEWGEVEFREEENYYFKLAEHKDWLLALIDKRDDLVTPAFRRNELRNAVERLAGDLCVSRPKSRLAWGIELPFDPDFVTFVWFDALVNYISFADYDPDPKAANKRFHELWPALHVIGKDIMIPAHGVYWPIMLKGLGFTDDQIPPLLVHGWWNSAGEKMSKTLGNVVDPAELISLVSEKVEKALVKQKEKDAGKGKPTLSDTEIAGIRDRCGTESLRYYLVKEITTGKDSDFSEKRLVQSYNTDLANGLGNLLNRTVNMAQLYRQGRLSVRHEVAGAPDYVSTVAAYRTQFEGIQRSVADPEFDKSTKVPAPAYTINLALGEAMSSATLCNQLIDTLAPWKLAKDPAQADLLDAVLYTLAESLRIIAILIAPVMPKAASGIFAQLNWDKPFSLADTTWGGLPDGHVVGQPFPLFPRIEEPKE